MFLQRFQVDDSFVSQLNIKIYIFDFTNVELQVYKVNMYKYKALSESFLNTDKMILVANACFSMPQLLRFTPTLHSVEIEDCDQQRAGCFER